MEEILFTSAAVLDLLSSIDELRDYNIELIENPGSSTQLVIGDSAYVINNKDATDIAVDDDVVETIQDVTEDAYENLDDSIEVENFEEDQPIESGIIKEALKTLLVGGLVRFTSKLLR